VGNLQTAAEVHSRRDRPRRGLQAAVHTGTNMVTVGTDGPPSPDSYRRPRLNSMSESQLPVS